jgi:ribonuclease BN (tRNA processing enzyme)
MKEDIVLDVMGSTSPFSMMGESSGYMVSVNGHSYLLECGSPVFPTLGYTGISRIKGIFATHSHEDHKRWFTDIVLFTFYNPLFKRKIKLITSEVVLEEFTKNSKAALERSLSADSKRIVDISYDLMVQNVIVGPKSKYRIVLRSAENGFFYYQVEDMAGNRIGPEKAKIVINPDANRPRLLFRDPDTGEWVEPESYYPFSSQAFYEENRNVFHDEEAGLTVEALKSPAWHGVPTVAFRFRTAGNSLLFSADTVYKPALWKELYEEHRPQRFHSITPETFEKSSVLYGDINDFIERTWSRERYENAMSAYRGSVVIHDVARKKSIVHTDYTDIANDPIEDLFFTHNPDNLTALRPILTSGKRLVLRGGTPYESVKGDLHELDADVYVHHFSCNMVGYRAPEGAYKVIERDGILGIVEAGCTEQGLMRVDLFEDVGGEYFPLLKEPHQFYTVRADGQVEEITLEEKTSSGVVVQSRRGKLEGQKMNVHPFFSPPVGSDPPPNA